MIALLTGQVIHEEGDGTLVVDVGGVGYEVLAPLGTTGRLRGQATDARAPLTFHIHTHVREDTFQLFGFSSASEKSVFRLLIGVSTVGPRTAMSILSALPGPELARVIARKELGRLTTVPGIGKKIAERLLLELRDKLPVTGELNAAAVPAGKGTQAASTAAGAPAQREQLVSALTRLGYRQPEAERALDQLGDKLDTATLPELLKEALRLLAK